MQGKNLTFSTPESLGIPSGAITEFLDEITDRRICMHGFLLLRHGKVAAEGYWPPFDENRRHRVYSISKSFTSIAIGMMIDEGRITLDSKIVDFFPEYLPENPHRFLMEATVRDLLMMATCHKHTTYNWKSTDYVETFFSHSGEKHKPGQLFIYDTSATVVLCAIVEKLSGKTLLEYMMPVLEQTGFSKDAYCIETPEGRSWTGSGIMCTPRDLARFAQLIMNGGEWDGKQLLNRDYVTEATSWQIDSSVSAGGYEIRHGYGYQIWRLRKGGFAFYGIGSQYALCMPEHGTILVLTGDTQGSESAGDTLLNMYFKLLDKLSPTPLPEDANAQSKLAECISKLALPRPLGKTETAVAKEISGQKYILEKNDAGMKWLRLLIDADKCRLQYENAAGEQELVYGMGKYEPQLSPGKYNGRRMGVKDTHYQCIGAGAWAKDNCFLGTMYSVDDHLGSCKIQLTFEDNEVSGFMTKSAEDFFDEYQGFLVGKIEIGVIK